MTILLVVCSVLISIVILFQFALAAGMPWGELAMGGMHPGKFPPAMRVGAVVQGMIMAIALLIIHIRAGVFLPDWLPIARIAIWFVVAIFAISTVLNWITKSNWERRLWAPTITTILLITVYVALS